MDDVRGLVVESVDAGHGDTLVYLLCKGGARVSIAVEGDCCSESYFDADSIEAMMGLVGHTLASMEDVETDAPDSGCRQEYQKTHCLVITTDKESTSVLWRNDSNGYYDGTISVSVTRPSSDAMES